METQAAFDLPMALAGGIVVLLFLSGGSRWRTRLGLPIVLGVGLLLWMSGVA